VLTTARVAVWFHGNSLTHRGSNWQLESSSDLKRRTLLTMTVPLPKPNAESEARVLKLQGLKVVFVVADEVEDLEYHVPRMTLLEEGAMVVTAALKPGTYVGKGGLGLTASLATSELLASDFDAVVVPGGWAPDKMRRDQHILSFLQDMKASHKIQGYICHAGWVAASAGILEPGRPVTGSLGIKDDMLARGAVWQDVAAFRDDDLVWGRVVADIPDFCRELVAALKESRSG
jgi:protease I